MPKQNPSKRKTRKRVQEALTSYVRGELKKKNPRVKLPSTWTKAEIRVNDKGEPQIRLNPAKLGSGGRFAKCVKKVEMQGSAYDPRAVCAAAGRRKYGKKKFQAMAAAGRKRTRKNYSKKDLELWGGQKPPGPKAPRSAKRLQSSADARARRAAQLRRKK